MLDIPFTSDPAQSFSVSLAGVRLQLEARWNDIGQRWTLDIVRASDGVSLALGIPMLVGQDFLAPYALALGGMFATDLSGAGLDAGEDDLGSRVVITWISPDEVAVLAAIPTPPPVIPYSPPVIVPPPVTPPFTPLSLGSTLKLWLRGDLGITQSSGNATAWADQSGNGNHVANVGTVPFVASSINGQPGITCAANAGMQNLTSMALPAGSPRSLFFIVKASSTVGGVLFCNARSSHTQEAWLLGAGGSVPGLAYASDAASFETISPATISGVPLLISVMTTGAAGALVTYKINDVSQSVSNTGTTVVETGSAGFGIGILPYLTGTLGFIGDICEAIICDTVLSAPNEALVRNYALARYGT